MVICLMSALDKIFIVDVWNYDDVGQMEPIQDPFGGIFWVIHGIEILQGRTGHYGSGTPACVYLSLRNQHSDHIVGTGLFEYPSQIECIASAQPNHIFAA